MIADFCFIKQWVNNLLGPVLRKLLFLCNFSQLVNYLKVVKKYVIQFYKSENPESEYKSVYSPRIVSK